MITQKNINRNFGNSSVFEIGPVFFKNKSYEQEEYACGIRTGSFYEKSWLEKREILMCLI